MNKKIWEIKSFVEYRELNADFFKEHITKYEKLKNGIGATEFEAVLKACECIRSK